MSYCLNPTCQNPQNADGTKFCLTCGSKLLLTERYRAIRPIGEGGFGRTFLAMDENRLNASCVIKQFLPQFQGTTALQKATEMFNREAVQLLELGEHPQIPGLYAYFEQDKRLYLVQQFIDGQNLLQELQQHGAYSEQQIRELLLDLLPVLQFVHEHHVVHRDIKPENILRRKKDGKLVLVDFGVAKTGTGTALAKSGTTTGTQGYAPMEQIRGGQAYPASDLYGLGVTCIQLLARAMPDDLYDPLEGRWIWKEYLAQKGRSVSDRLERILDKMLQELVRDRYQSAAEVLQDLGAAAPPITPPTPQPPLAPKSSHVTTIQPGKPDRIASELEEMRSQMSQPQPATPPAKPAASTNPSPSKSPSPGFDPLQADLESIKSEFGSQS